MDEHKEDPFLNNLHYYSVHRPIVERSEELTEKYMNKAGDPITGQGNELTGKRKIQEAKYASMIESLDDNVGRIVEFLEKKGLRENTLILFTSDNGQNVGLNNNLCGKKGYVYAGGLRVPTFVNWPGKIDARRSGTPISGLDFFPTFMDLAGINYTGVLDGDSITELFIGEPSHLQHRALFWHIASQYRNGTCSIIRKNNHKLIQFLATGDVELYDLVKDPTEPENLAKSNPEVAEELLNELTSWQKNNTVPLPPNSVVQH